MAGKIEEPNLIEAIKVLHSHVLKCFDEIYVLTIALSEKGIIEPEDLKAAHRMIANYSKTKQPIEPGKGFLYLISDQSKSKKEEDKL